MIAGLLAVYVGICLLVSGTAGSECCLAHYGDILVQDNDAMWCEDYCCQVPTKYYCCDDILLQADSWDREKLCGDYFDQHVWIPVVISLGCAGLIVACCVCCCCCCCRRGDRGGGAVFIPSGGGSGPNVTVVNSSTNSMQSSTNSMPSMLAGPPGDPYRTGYDQGK